MKEKQARLEKIISEYGSLAVAFSGGVDSTYLLYEAKRILGDKCLAITINLIGSTKEELLKAKEFSEQIGVQDICVYQNELSIEGFSDNPPDRCYICKREIFSLVRRVAEDNGLEHVAEGTNADDPDDYRPGMKALKELNIKSPLMEAGLSKDEVRALSKEAGLSTWNKPSSPCLSSRIPYGEKITKEKLSMIGQAEGYLRSIGFETNRVRTHGTLARIEVAPDRISEIMKEDIREDITGRLKEIGYEYISVDILGFRSGSLNDILNLEKT